MYKKFIDPKSFRLERTGELVPGRMEVSERYENGVLIRTATRTVTPLYEIGCEHIGSKRVGYKLSPTEVKCVHCGWQGTDDKLKYEDNGEEEDIYYGEYDEEWCRNENFEDSAQVCPECGKWHCLDKDDHEDLDIIRETLDEFRERFGIKERITEHNLDEIKKIINKKNVR